MRTNLAYVTSTLSAFVFVTSAYALEVGEIHDSKELPLSAWVNKMPGSPPSLHVRGFITAPTPCHTTVTRYEGDSKTNPPIYRIKISFVDPPKGTICLQTLWPVEFDYDQQNYAGNHASVEIFSDTHSRTKDLETAQ
jgi:hypothetical protein